jgi:hypothetical protein
MSMDGVAPVTRKSPATGWSMLDVMTLWTRWCRGNYLALSSVAYIDDQHQPPHWEWVVSFSHTHGRRLTNEEVLECLRDFDAGDFEEDNHEDGIVRKFWLAVDPQYRTPCPCKDEDIVTEGDYSYSIKKGG